MADETDIVEASIVMVGKFNPAIFSPAWLAKNGVITDEEMAESEIEVIHRRITRFTIEHLTLGVDLNRFSISISSEPIIKLADYVLQIFGGLLPHTPIAAIGINYSEHWRLDSWQRRVALGRELAPPKPWGRWGDSWQGEDPETIGGLAQLIVLENYGPEGHGRRQVEIGPSPELADKVRGVFLGVNHHRDIQGSEADGAKAATEIVAQEFDSAVREARKIIGAVRDFAQTLEIR